MTREDILKKINNIIDIQQKQHFEINEKTQLGSMAGSNYITVSSLEYVELIVEIENTFDIIIDFDIDLYVMEDIINYIINYYREKTYD